MKALGIFIICIMTMTPLFSAQNESMEVGLMNDNFGLFSVVFYVTGVMHEYEKGNYTGVNVDFGKRGPYYQKKYGLNWWNYYFEPIEFHSETVRKKNVTSRHGHFAFFIEYNDRKKNNLLIEKYIHVKAHILEKVDTFQKAKFDAAYVIGVHYRGTDKKTEAPTVKYETVLREINRHVALHGLTDYLVFLATDEQAFVDYLERQLINKVVKYDCHRSTNNNPVHLNGKAKYKKGEEALIDCLLLSRCHFLIRTSSNLSLCSTFFNPELPVLELSQRR